VTPTLVTPLVIGAKECKILCCGVDVTSAAILSYVEVFLHGSRQSRAHIVYCVSCCCVVAGTASVVHVFVKRVHQRCTNLQQHSPCELCHSDATHHQVLLLGHQPSQPQRHRAQGHWLVYDIVVIVLLFCDFLI